MALTRRRRVLPLAFSGWIVFWAVTYILRTSDKENYATTILQFSNTSGIRSKFLSLSFADLGLAFGTNFPLLGYFDLTPLPLLSAILDVSFAWIIYASLLVFLCNYIVVKNLFKITSSSVRVFLATCLLTSLSPVWMDSNLYNDWPATWSSSVFTIMVWTMLFASLYAGTLTRFDSLLMAYFSANVFVNDPGYFPIFLIGVSSVMIGFSRSHLRSFSSLFWRNFKSDFLPYLCLFFYFVVVSYELFYLGGKFNTQARSFSDSQIYNEILNFFKPPILAYHPRGIGVYFPLLIAFLSVLVFKSRFSRLTHRYTALAFITFVASCVPVGKLISFYNIDPKFFFFYPTGGFFLRDTTVFLLIVIIVVNSGDSQKKILRNGVSNSILLAALIYQLSFSVIIESSSHLGVKPLFPLHKLVLGDDLIQEERESRSSGIAFTRLASEQSRSGSYHNFWMSTDFQQSGDRLLTASTKLQSKDFFNPSKATFQASTISGDASFWCGTDSIRNYWVDYVVTAKSEIATGECRNSPIQDFGDLRVYLVNQGKDSNHDINIEIVKDNLVTSIFRLPVVVSSNGRNLILQVTEIPEGEPWEMIRVSLPIEYSSNLKARIGKEAVAVKRGEGGFSQIDHRDIRKTLVLYYEPTITQKFRIIASYLSLFFFIFYTSRKRVRLNSRPFVG
jgi:hypothetical protein